MTRFFVTPEELTPEFLVLTGDNAQHAKVLRLKNGEEVLVCDGEGRECLCTISDVSPGQLSLVVKKRQEATFCKPFHLPTAKNIAYPPAL